MPYLAHLVKCVFIVFADPLVSKVHFGISLMLSPNAVVPRDSRCPRCTPLTRSPFATSHHLRVMEAHMEDLQQLEIECPFCGEMQPRETAR
jgi:hypothetical protein